MNDDAFILRCSRALRKRNERIVFHAAAEATEGFTVAVTIMRQPMEGETPWEVADRTASASSLTQRGIAHARRQALENLMVKELLDEVVANDAR